MTPLKDADYALSVPVGTSIEIARRMDEVRRRGPAVADALHGEERRYARGRGAKAHIGKSDLAEANGLSLSAPLRRARS